MKENFSFKEISEKENSIETETHLSAEKALRRIEKITECLGPALAARLVEANVVLTMADARGQTEFFITEPTEEELKEIKKINTIMNNEGVQFGAPKMFLSASDKSPTAMISIRSLEGYAKTSRETHIPGILPFDPHSGWDGLKRWRKETRKNLLQARASGELPKDLSNDSLDHLFTGVVKGYPDRAILDLVDEVAHNRGIEKMDSSKISHVALYGGAEPNYDYYPEHAQDPVIIAHQTKWGNILEKFYASSWHKSIAENLEFKAMRTKMENIDNKYRSKR